MDFPEPKFLYNEVEFAKTPKNRREIFIYEWLRKLENDLSNSTRPKVKVIQKDLTAQLSKQLKECLGPPTRDLLAKCFAVMFSVGDTFSVLETVNICTDTIKSRDDTPAFLPLKLTAVACIGAMFEKLGRMVGGSCQETVQILIKAMKNIESQGKCEILLCLQRIMDGIGQMGASVHKDVYKASRNCMLDRSMPVRCAAANCTLGLIKHAPFIYMAELEAMVSTCLKALEGSNYDVRICISQLLGTLMAATQQSQQAGNSKAKKPVTLEEVLSLMSGGFLRGGMGFLKGSGGELLKGSAPREVRVGVTQSYVILFNELGGMWVSKNIGLILTHVLELLSNPKATNTHVDAVYSRRCVSFILRAVLGRLLDDSTQIEAAKEICTLITKKMNLVNNIIHSYTDNSTPSGVQGMEEVINTQHVLICALQELGSLIQGLGTSALLLVSENVIDHVVSVLLHPAPAAQLAAAWCLRCVTVAVPSQLTPTIDRCIDRINSLKASGEAVGGYTHALAALIGGVYQCPLGIPHAKGKLVFSIIEGLLKTTSTNPRLVLNKSKAGWVLMGALMTLGPSVVKEHLPRMLVLWTSAFPLSAKEFEQEKSKGDSFTWHVTLENRAGALCSMSSFVRHCSALVTPDLIRKLLVPVESCLSMMTSFPQIVKQHGNHLKASIAMIRLRAYTMFSSLPPKTYESSFHGLLRELVAEFTLADNPSLTTTSLLRTVCHKDDTILLGTWLQETDHKSVEEQLQPNSASGSGALEHDPACVYDRCPQGEEAPGPLPLGVAVIDASIRLFGFILPSVAHKHRSQLLVHFAECIRQAKSSRQQAIQTNILTAFLCALKYLAEAKVGLGGEDVRSTATSLVLDAVINPDPIVRCAAGEALGRIAQVVGNPAFTSNIAQKIFDQLRSARDAVSRTGHSVALGCLHRYVGGMGAGHHLNTSVSILLALSQDNTSTIVQVWALHALALIADSGGPMFRGYVEPTLSQVVDLTLVAPPSMTEVHQCLGKALAALITSIGPELQGGSQKIKSLRLRCVVSCAVMQNHPDSLVQAEAINCLQQLHVFAPSHVNLLMVVRKLCSNLSSPHLLLRRASVACLRQLSQREAKEVCEHAMAAGEEGSNQQSSYGVVVGDKGLEGALFSMLDNETDVRMRSDIRYTLTSMLQTLAPHALTHWLSLCRDVLSASKRNKAAALEQQQETGKEDKKNNDDEDEDEEGGMTINEVPETHPKVSPRWPTRIFATECVRKIIGACETKRAHIDLALAREFRQETGEDFLVMHLQELVRMAFIAATAQSDQLKLEGLQTLQDIVHVFTSVPDPDFPGHVLLEQFQAQVGAALRPAFAPDMPSDVTAMASEVCSSWIAGGIARDLNDVRRIQQLLVTKLSKFSVSKKAALQLYNEAATTMEKLAVLKAWAEVYIVAIKQKSAPPQLLSEEDYGAEPPGSLLQLVEPELMSLSKYWLGALKDHALLTLPPEYGPQMPVQGGMFYSPDSMEQARPHYRNCWPSLVHATALWLSNGGLDMASNEALSDTETNSSSFVTATKTKNEVNKDRFHLLVGICMESLCSSRSSQSNATVSACLHAFYSLLDAPKQREIIGKQQMLAVEMLNVLHRIMLTRDTHEIQQCVMCVVQQVSKASQEEQQSQLDAFKANDNDEPSSVGEEDLTPGKSVVFGIMEICLCVLTRNFPSLVPASPSSKKSSGLLVSVNHSTNIAGFSEESAKLVSTAVSSLALTPDLCSAKASVTVLPSVMYLITNVLREVSMVNGSSRIVPSILQAYKSLARSRFTVDPRCSQEWIRLLRSTLATILDAAKADQTGKLEQQVIDESVVLLALAIFIHSAPRDVILAGNLLDHSMNVFQRCVRSADSQVRLKALQTVSSIFQCQDRSISVPFIQNVSPHIVMVLNDACFNKPNNESQFGVFIEATKTLELLIDLTEEHLRVHLLGILIPILVHFLLDNQSINKTTKSLNEHCLQRLMKIGPKYPQPFKAVMTLSPELKQRLEKAIRAHQASSAAKAPKVETKVAPAQPSIKLRMDFSNFK